MANRYTQKQEQTMSTTTDYGPSFRACKLFRRKSQRTGNTYVVGRFGSARVLLLKSDEDAHDGGELWDLKLAEAPPKADQLAEEARREPTRLVGNRGGAACTTLGC